LIDRVVFPQVPPRVEYVLTDLGRSVEPLLRGLNDWGTDTMPRQRNPTPGPEN
jgi:DNA-binding HxlR family transcriptional regulator